MDELLYSIEITKSDTGYIGKVANNNNELKHFKNEFLDDLLQDIVDDLTLDFDTANENPKDFFDDID
jgi:hypothetical protein